MAANGLDVTIRDLREDDRAGWDPLWAEYLEHYGEELAPEVTEATFQRLTGDGGGRDLRMGGLAAVDADGALIGLAHYVVSPSTWSRREEAYLSDLVVSARIRGQGVGHVLLDALAQRGREQGWRRIHWITEEHNTTARRLYDHVGTFQGFIQYELELADDAESPRP